jgi:cobalamin biosynthesis protein CobW
MKKIISGHPRLIGIAVEWRCMPVPALIVSGWLGAGKTTLVGHLLDAARKEGVRIAIVSNEFGNTGIDRALLDAGEDGFVELDGGCVCCRLSDALGETIEAVVQRAHPDRIVLETSGVALPGEVLVQFWRPPIADLVSEEAVVVVVDAHRVGEVDEPDDTWLAQLEAADIVVLNKCDLVAADRERAAAERVSAWSGGRPCIRAIRGRVDPALLFPPDPEGVRRTRRDPRAEVTDHDHERFETFEIPFPGVVGEDEVLRRIEEHDALRAKGFVRTPEGLRVVQGVGSRIELSEPRTPPPPHLVGRIVVIRRGTH